MSKALVDAEENESASTDWSSPELATERPPQNDDAPTMRPPPTLVDPAELNFPPHGAADEDRVPTLREIESEIERVLEALEATASPSTQRVLESA
jgi:hypothetical protein